MDMIGSIMSHKVEVMSMNDEKVDKGFELSYYKLSYRRRFIRTLWMIPWAILALFGLHWLGYRYTLVIVGIIFAVVGFVQAFHNYKLWKSEENE